MGKATEHKAIASRLEQVKNYASFIRDVGVILGIPILLKIGLNVYDLQTKAFKAQVKANEAQITALEAQNAVLKETQYDRALTIIKSQREVYIIEREKLERQIDDLKTSGKNREDLVRLTSNLITIEKILESFFVVTKSLDNNTSVTTAAPPSNTAVPSEPSSSATVSPTSP